MNDQQKTLYRHYHLANDALDSLKSALSNLEELDPAVAYQWDGLSDLRRELREVINRNTQLVSGYQKDMQ